MAVYEKNGKWYYKCQLFGVRKHGLCKGCDTRSKALEYEAEVKEKLSLIYRGKKSEAEIITLKEMFDNLELYSKSNNSESQYKSHKRNGDALKQYFGSTTTIDVITPMGIEKFRKYLLSFKKKRATVNRYIATLSKAFNLIIVERKLSIVNPCTLIHPFKEDNKLQRYLTEDEEKRLLKEIAPHLKPIVICALTTGLRLANILNLRWEAIDVKMDYLEVLKQENKGHKKIQIPLSKKFKDELIKIGVKKKGYVFINPMTKKPYTTIKTGFTRACQRAGIDNLRFHDLRHTVGTRLISKGADLQTVKEYLAHSDIKTTQRYLHPVNANMKNAVQILDDFVQNDEVDTQRTQKKSKSETKK